MLPFLNGQLEKNFFFLGGGGGGVVDTGQEKSRTINSSPPNSSLSQRIRDATPAFRATPKERLWKRLVFAKFLKLLLSLLS